MSLRVHWLQHASFEDLGCIAPWLAAQGHQLSCTRLYANEALPSINAFDWIIVMGGPMNIYEYDAYPWLRAEKQWIDEAIAANKRVLGICLGSQLIADTLGGKVTRNAQTEIGWFPVQCSADHAHSSLLADFPSTFNAFHWHGDTFAVPPGAQHLASSAACSNQAFAYGERVIALQFHPEVTASNVRDWLAHEQVAPSRYVQAPDAMLEDIPRYATINRLMLKLLRRLEAA
jgi:GMP synthase-like glutamine amidotransferase